MKLYECLIIYPGEMTPDARKAQDTSFEALLQKHKAKIVTTTDLGKKSLGYPVQKHKDGSLMVFDLQMEENQLNDFRKGLELQEGIIKYMLTIKVPVSAAPEKPKSAATPVPTRNADAPSEPVKTS